MFIDNAAQCFIKSINRAIEEGDRVCPRGIPCFELLNEHLVINNITAIQVKGIEKYQHTNFEDALITAYSALQSKISVNAVKTYENPYYDVYAYLAGEKFKEVIKTLRKDKDSRQATVMLGIRHCTNIISYYIRDNKLYCMVHSRSLDMFNKGITDLSFLCILQQLVANSLCVEYGTLTWNIGSLHIYEKDVDKFKELINKETLICWPHNEKYNAEDFLKDKYTFEGMVEFLTKGND